MYKGSPIPGASHHGGRITPAISFDPRATCQVQISTPFWREQNQCPERVVHFRGRSQTPQPLSSSAQLSQGIAQGPMGCLRQSGWAEGWQGARKFQGKWPGPGGWQGGRGLEWVA